MEGAFEGLAFAGLIAAQFVAVIALHNLDRQGVWGCAPRSDARFRQRNHDRDSRMKNDVKVGPCVQTWLMTATVLVAGTCIAAFVYAGAPSIPGTSLAQFECVSLDKAASARVAALVSDDSAGSSLRLDRAIAQLRLARAHCHNGADTVARVNYEALAQLPTNRPAVTAQGD